MSEQTAPQAARRTIWRDVAALLILNVFVCRELFFLEYSQYLGSIEAAYIAISRYLIDHPFEFGWFPLWYCGVPFQNTYPPLLHMLVAIASWIGGTSTALGHHFVTAALYSLGPVTLYLLARALSGRRDVSLVAALAYSLMSPAAWVSRQIQTWVSSPWEPVRLQGQLIYGDSPHIASVTLLPLGALALHWALQRPRPLRVYLAACALAAVVLTNWLGAFALALSALAYLLARGLETRRLSDIDFLRAVGWSALIAVIAYALVSPWIPPSTIGDIRYNAQHVIGSYPMTAAHLGYAAAMLPAATLLGFALRRLRASLAWSFSAFTSLFFGSLVLLDDWAAIQLMPQPHRYHHEMELSFCLLGALAGVWLARRLPTPARIALAGAFGAALVVQLGNYREGALQVIQPADMPLTLEYRAGVWFRENFPDDRVFASGSVQFWLNAFADTRQVGGGFGQGIVNRQIPMIQYGVPWTVGNGEQTAMWLRLYGARAALVSGPQGRDFFRGEWRDPDKFDGVLPELWREGDDAIYRIPQRGDSLAHVIRAEHVVQRSPDSMGDVGPAEPLAAALEDPLLPAATLEWDSPDRGTISAALTRDHLLFVQVAYHPGWRASVEGEPRAIHQDGLGFMVIDPGCVGDCEIELTYDGGLEMTLLRLLSGLTMLAGVVWAAALRIRRQTPRPSGR